MTGLYKYGIPYWINQKTKEIEFLIARKYSEKFSLSLFSHSHISDNQTFAMKLWGDTLGLLENSYQELKTQFSFEKKYGTGETAYFIEITYNPNLIKSLNGFEKYLHQCGTEKNSKDNSTKFRKIETCQIDGQKIGSIYYDFQMMSASMIQSKLVNFRPSSTPILLEIENDTKSLQTLTNIVPKLAQTSSLVENIHQFKLQNPLAYIIKLRKAHADYILSLKPKYRDSITYYSGLGSRVINGYLRSDPAIIINPSEIPIIKAHINNLNQILNNAPMTSEPIFVYRGINFDLLPKNSKLKEGDIVDYFQHHFNSTSFSLDISATQFAGHTCCLYIVHLPPGIKCLYIDKHSKHNTENELLLAPGPLFQVFKLKHESFPIKNMWPAKPQLLTYRLGCVNCKIAYEKYSQNIYYGLGFSAITPLSMPTTLPVHEYIDLADKIMTTKTGKAPVVLPVSDLDNLEELFVYSQTLQILSKTIKNALKPAILPTTYGYLAFPSEVSDGKIKPTIAGLGFAIATVDNSFGSNYHEIVYGSEFQKELTALIGFDPIKVANFESIVLPYLIKKIEKATGLLPPPLTPPLTKGQVLPLPLLSKWNSEEKKLIPSVIPIKYSFLDFPNILADGKIESPISGLGFAIVNTNDFCGVGHFVIVYDSEFKKELTALIGLNPKINSTNFESIVLPYLIKKIEKATGLLPPTPVTIPITPPLKNPLTKGHLLPLPPQSKWNSEEIKLIPSVIPIKCSFLDFPNILADGKIESPISGLGFAIVNYNNFNGSHFVIVYDSQFQKELTTLIGFNPIINLTEFESIVLPYLIKQIEKATGLLPPTPVTNPITTPVTNPLKKYKVLPLPPQSKWNSEEIKLIPSVIPIKYSFVDFSNIVAAGKIESPISGLGFAIVNYNDFNGSHFVIVYGSEFQKELTTLIGSNPTINLTKFESIVLPYLIKKIEKVTELPLPTSVTTPVATPIAPPLQIFKILPLPHQSKWNSEEKKLIPVILSTKVEYSDFLDSLLDGKFKSPISGLGFAIVSINNIYSYYAIIYDSEFEKELTTLIGLNSKIDSTNYQSIVLPYLIEKIEKDLPKKVEISSINKLTNHVSIPINSDQSKWNYEEIKLIPATLSNKYKYSAFLNAVYDGKIESPISGLGFAIVNIADIYGDDHYELIYNSQVQEELNKLFGKNFQSVILPYLINKILSSLHEEIIPMVFKNKIPIDFKTKTSIDLKPSTKTAFSLKSQSTEKINGKPCNTKLYISGKICNPKTGNWLLTSAKTYKDLLKEYTAKQLEDYTLTQLPK
jgi:hypothetical protein